MNIALLLDMTWRFYKTIRVNSNSIVNKSFKEHLQTFFDPEILMKLQLVCFSSEFLSV